MKTVPTRFFFFQAEDGIRDIGVTGVQTCALPIYEAFVALDDGPGGTLESAQDDAQFLRIERVGQCGRIHQVAEQDGDLAPLGLAMPDDRGRLRSEERRVGKECRSRWSPYH